MPSFSVGREAPFSARVSAEDLAWVTQWRWTFLRSWQLVYVRRCVRRDGLKVTILLSHAILERAGLPRPGPDYDADHVDRDTLNYERPNLRWLPAVENRRRGSRNQLAYRRKHGHDGEQQIVPW